MRPSGYYWVQCTNKICCPHPNHEIAYYDCDSDLPWFTIFSETALEEDAFTVTSKVYHSCDDVPSAHVK